MFPIDPRAAIHRAAAPAARQAAAPGSRFRLDGGRQESASVGGVTASAPLDALVALQAEEDTTERKKRQVKRGHDLLDGLDRLKADLLAGRVSPAQLQALKTQLGARREATGDAGLDELIAFIELRVAVELAKLGR
jgi:hypothetical protein